MSILKELVSNISVNFSYLKQDYIGIHLSFNGLLTFFLECLIPVVIFLIFFLIGQRIKQVIFKKDYGPLNFFIEIIFGFIFCSTGMLIFGMLGILYRNILYVYYIFLLFIALFPLSSLSNRLSPIKDVYGEYRRQFSKDKLVNIAILCFVIISFLRLLPPETGVDAVWYHTDYPHQYLNSHSMMTINPRGQYYPEVTPTLSDMLYVVTESVSQIDASRFINYAFYLLIILEYLVIFRKRYKFAPYAALLFVSCPIVIRVSSSAYAEFPWMMCWLPVVYLITEKKISLKDVSLAAILFGGTLATKIWMLPFYGVTMLYFFTTNICTHKMLFLKILVLFSLFSLSIPFLWYIRAYLVTGNPLFPTFWVYPDGGPANAFHYSYNLESLKVLIINFVKSSPLHFDYSLADLKVRVANLANLSPLSVFGLLYIIFLLITQRLKLLKLSNNPLIIFTLILTIINFLINYSYHRFLMPWYLVLALVLAAGAWKFANKNLLTKCLLWGGFGILFLYYSINTLLIMPYGLGFASQNNYLTRILSRDNSSYYDFGGKFSPYLSPKDTVATYHLWGFYYANFKYVYSEDIFRKDSRSLNSLLRHGANKVLILGGDIDWMCKSEQLTDCTPNKYKLLSFYKFPTTLSSQYLYQLNLNEK